MITEKLVALLVIEGGQRRLVEGAELREFVDENGIALRAFQGVGLNEHQATSPVLRECILRGPKTKARDDDDD